MLRLLGFEQMEDLLSEVIPADIRVEPHNRRAPSSEAETLSRLREIASANRVFRSYIGAGYHRAFTPSVIQRNLLENPAWYTAYTPYQPEISQGRLELLLAFQQMVCDLTGLEIANASLLDESTAAAEAMTLSRRASKSESDIYWVSDQVHPQTISVLRTRAEPIGVELLVSDLSEGLPAGGVFGALLQYPGTHGEVLDLSDAVSDVHRSGGLATVAADPLALTLLRPPGDFGADIAIGSTQRFGVPLFYGGPHAGYIATRETHKRLLPGRLIGVSVDRHGDTALRMALQTREQHIRRDRATSNICTAQALLAITATLYAMHHGRAGLQKIARRVHQRTVTLATGLRALGFRMTHEHYFDTLSVEVGSRDAEIHRRAESSGLNFRRLTGGRIGVSLDETTTASDVEEICGCFAESGRQPHCEDALQDDHQMIPTDMLRDDAFLEHPLFLDYQSETEMMRYLRRLADKDLALDRTMIPLGSCTMKLNAAVEMAPVTWPEFCDIHPHAPAAQTRGYEALVQELEEMLCAATGYDAVSLQPNAGSQGEFAGLMAIRAYQASRGEGARDACLIPTSAHGTNPASAKMAGMRVVPVACDSLGNIDIADLSEKAQRHSDRLAAIMITYPSTHGVFEETVDQICAIVHEHGGQVYIDGANLNAQVGLCEPGSYGGDVSHLNLHKTFCIPHGGGGPGVGPVAVKRHLAPYLPVDPLGSEPGAPGPAISAAAQGSAGILPISWAYAHLMGDAGLRAATEHAILHANYMASRLEPHYPILYKGATGFVAHECIIDLRPLKESAGVTVEDVAKRLIDYGFHAPTVSFPVAGTMMIEPTESESLREIDRFCDAMIAIRGEIAKIEAGDYPREDNPLVNAPHTAEAVTIEAWTHPYSRRVAAFPSQDAPSRKYWPPVGRIDHAHGDRNLFCSCPPMGDDPHP